MAISNSELLCLSDRTDSHKSHSQNHRLHDSNNTYKFTVSSSFWLLSVRRWQTINGTTATWVQENFWVSLLCFWL